MKSTTLKEHHERQRLCFPKKALQDGEEQMLLTPAFDLRDTADKTYGQHTCELIFAKRKGNHIASSTIFTGWSVDGGRVMMQGKDIGFMNTGIGIHYLRGEDAPEYASHMKDCPFTGGECWFNLGSSLYGDVVMQRMLDYGSYGVWAELDGALARELVNPE